MSSSNMSSSFVFFRPRYCCFITFSTSLYFTDPRAWPTLLDAEDLPRKKLTAIYRAPTAEMIAYLDFSVSTTGNNLIFHFSSFPLRSLFPGVSL